MTEKEQVMSVIRLYQTKLSNDEYRQLLNDIADECVEILNNLDAEGK